MCAYPGCGRKARNKGRSASGAGGYRFGRYCKEHHKFTGITGKKSLIDNNIPCEVCGWDKSYCDRHRTSPDIRYHRTEVVIVCPNCHRLINADKMRVRRLRDGKILVTGPCVKEVDASGRITLRGISEYTGKEAPLEVEPEPTEFLEENRTPQMPTGPAPVASANTAIGTRVKTSQLAREAAKQNKIQTYQDADKADGKASRVPKKGQQDVRATDLPPKKPKRTTADERMKAVRDKMRAVLGPK